MDSVHTCTTMSHKQNFFYPNVGKYDNKIYVLKRSNLKSYLKNNNFVEIFSLGQTFPNNESFQEKMFFELQTFMKKKYSAKYQ